MKWYIVSQPSLRSPEATYCQPTIYPFYLPPLPPPLSRYLRPTSHFCVPFRIVASPLRLVPPLPRRRNNIASPNCFGVISSPMVEQVAPMAREISIRGRCLFSISLWGRKWWCLVKNSKGYDR